MIEVGYTGYIKYKDKITKVTVTEIRFGSYIIVETEDGELLGIPPEDDTYIFKTYEDCYRDSLMREVGGYFVCMEDN